MPKLLPNNYPVIYLLRNYGSVLGSGMGGLLLSEILLACEYEEITPTYHLVNRIINYYRELNIKEEEDVK